MGIDIFIYIDYRKYLADFYAEAKRSSPFFSYQYMALKTSMDTSNLAKVLLGRRHLPKKSIPHFKALCKMSDHEFEYFKCMIQWAKARNEKQARHCFEQLTRMQGSQPHVLDAMQFEYYRHWYHTALYALLDVVDFRGNYRKLAALLQPKISVQEAKDSVELLIRLGLVKIDGNNRYVPVQKSLSTGERWQTYAVHQFQKETTELALRSLEVFDKKERDISTLTFSASPADIAALNQLTREYRRSVIELISNASGADRIYQLNCQLFPLSVRIAGDHE